MSLQSDVVDLMIIANYEFCDIKQFKFQILKLDIIKLKI